MNNIDINNLTDLQSLIMCIFPFIENENIHNMDEITQTHFINYLTGFINGFNFINGFIGCGFEIETSNIIVKIENGNNLIISLNKIIDEYFLNGWN